MVVRYIKKRIETEFIKDTYTMLQGCSLKRPDLFFDLNKHCVIVEIDENQHKSYKDQCECNRINEIVGVIGGRPITIIRFNPDKILNNKNEIIIDLTTRLNQLI